MWPGWASLVLAQKPYASKIQSCKVTLRSTTDLVICSEPQPAYESPCLHVREHFQQQEEEEEDAWVKEHKSENVCSFSLKDISMEEKEGERKAVTFQSNK